MRVEFGLDPRQQVVADPSVTEQFVGRLEDEAVGAVEPVVALRELIDLVGGDVALEGDLDVLAPLVGGPPNGGRRAGSPVRATAVGANSVAADSR